MTAQQVELLGILRDFGPLTRQAIAEILEWKGAVGDNVGSAFLNAIGKRLCTLKRLGWAECVNRDTIKMSDGWHLGYYLRNRKLWAIAYHGFQALEAKEVKHEN